jgi:hypothetical protein
VTDTAVIPAEQGLDLALLKAVGLDRAAPEQRQLAIAIADRYGLDLMLKHLVLIEGRPYVTRDALIHIAHRSGQFDGIEVTAPRKDEGYWRCTATVWRKDMTHPFTYGGRYPASGGNAKFAEEMAVKVAESMALRRAFDVAAPVVEERWDVDAPAEPPAPRPTLAERAATRAAEVSPQQVRAHMTDEQVAVVLDPLGSAATAYLNAEEVAEGARPILRLPPSEEAPPWTRQRLHDAAVAAHVPGTLVTEAFSAVAGTRTRQELTEADWREIAVRLGLGA